MSFTWRYFKKMKGLDHKPFGLRERVPGVKVKTFVKPSLKRPVSVRRVVEPQTLPLLRRKFEPKIRAVVKPVVPVRRVPTSSPVFVIGTVLLPDHESPHQVARPGAVLYASPVVRAGLQGVGLPLRKGVGVAQLPSKVAAALPVFPSLGQVVVAKASMRKAVATAPLERARRQPSLKSAAHKGVQCIERPQPREGGKARASGAPNPGRKPFVPWCTEKAGPGVVE